jgi:hypothetical protein
MGSIVQLVRERVQGRYDSTNQKSDKGDICNDGNLPQQLPARCHHCVGSDESRKDGAEAASTCDVSHSERKNDEQQHVNCAKLMRGWRFDCKAAKKFIRPTMSPKAKEFRTLLLDAKAAAAMA